jgi:CubicO group peptidase (beta-lactamase class C family)
MISLLKIPCALVLAVTFGLIAPLHAELSRDEVQTAVLRMDAVAERAMSATGIPGMAIAVVHNDEVIFQKGYGVRKIGGGQPVTPDTVFQIASVSKPISSTIVAGLVGDGALTWDTPIVENLPNFRLSNATATREVSARDAFSHRSGLPPHAGDLLENLGFQQDQILPRLRQFPLLGGFRSRYEYSNFGLTVGALAAASAAGTDWPTIAERRLFAPLGMTSTSMRHSDFLARSNRAAMHVPADNRNLILDGKWVARFRRNAEAEAPAGGVSTNLRDMTRWMRLQLAAGRFEGRQIIAAAPLGETHRPQIKTGGGFYGLGWNVGKRFDRTVWSHSGEFFQGVRSAVSLCPEENLGLIILCNSAPHGIPEGLDLSLYDFLFRGELSRDWITFANERFAEATADQLGRDTTPYTQRPADFTPPRDLSAYAGRYRSGFYGSVRLQARGNRLIMTIGPDRQRYVVRHYSGDTFYYMTRGEDRTGLRSASFANPRNARFRQLNLPALNDYYDFDDYTEVFVKNENQTRRPRYTFGRFRR